MKIAFDISQTGASKAGCGYYAHALADALPRVAPQNHYYLLRSFGDFFFDAKLSRLPESHTQNVQTGPHFFRYDAAKSFWNSAEVETKLNHPHIIHANNYWCPLQPLSARLVYTLYDLSFLEHPEWTTEANRLGCFEGLFRAAQRADWIVAISEASRRHFLKYFPHFPQERLKVIYPASRFTDPDRQGAPPQALRNIAAGGFWLSVGTIEPRKNQKMLVEAYARYLERGGSPMPLVLAGGTGWMMDDFTQHIDALGIAHQVVMTGYVTDEEMIWLYRNCYANLYPSFFEGFGLPVLEGMQFGAPTITSNSTSLPEVAGDAAILIDAEDLDGWSRALVQFSSETASRDAAAEKSRLQAARFSWEASTAALLDLYEEALRQPKRATVRIETTQVV